MLDYIRKLITPDMVSFWVPSGQKGGIDLIGRNPKVQCIGTHPNVPTIAPPIDQINDCDTLTDWTASLGGVLSIDEADKKEGTGSLKNTIASPEIGTYYKTIYAPTGTWDWSNKESILFWLNCDRPSIEIEAPRLLMQDISGNWRTWTLVFSAGEWTAYKFLLSTGDDQSEIAPDLTLIVLIYVYFKAADETAFYKKIDDVRVTAKPSLINTAVGHVFGGDDYVGIFHGGSINSSSVTVGAWINIVASDEWQSIVANSEGKTVDRQWMLSVSTIMELSVHTYNGIDWAERLSTTMQLSESMWHRVVMSIDHENTIIKLYIDGIEKGSVAETGTLGRSPTYVTIGNRWGGAWVDGDIVLPFVANKAWSAAQVKNDWLSTRGLFAPRG